MIGSPNEHGHTSAPLSDVWTPVVLPPPGSVVAVGLSGGVDSAVTALRLREGGCEVIGVTTKNFCESDLPVPPDETSCCSAEAIAAARELCADLGVSHRVLDVTDAFRQHVIDDFVAEYLDGRTPNPCVRCNGGVRFPRLQSFARQLGADYVASGHYVRLMRHPDAGLFVARGVDRNKDQSYFLYRLKSQQLESIRFPLGASTKDEVRAEARRSGLPCAEAAESQEICFVPGGDRTPFIADLGDPGEIVDEAGSVLGPHRGLGHYTIGQRKGLGLGGGSARFVLSIDREQNRVVVGGEHRLAKHVLRCDSAIWRDPEPGPGLTARTRYRHPGTAVAAVRREGDGLDVRLALPDRAPAPGQSLVLYRGELVVGGGRIISAVQAAGGNA